MAMLSEVAILVLPLVLAFLFLVGRRTKKQEEGCKPKLPPGPPRLPIIGNLHQLGKCPHQTLHQLSKQYGPLMLLRLGDIPTVVISSAEIAEQVLKTHDLLFCSRAATTTLSRLSYNLSDVVASPYNAKWRELRKIVLHKLLSPKMVESFRPVREEEIERMISSISHLSSLSEPVNLAKLLTLFTNNVISRVAFGKIFHSEGSTDQKNGFHNLLMKSEAMFSAFFARDYFAWAGWVDVLSGQRARLGKTYTELDAFYQKVIAEHEDPIMRTEEKEDIVDVLLRLQKEDNHLTQDQVKGVLMNVLLAGTHTTSITLEYAMAELMRNPSVMLKAQEEVRRVVGDKGKVDESDISQLNYFKLVVKEMLRLHPMLPFLISRDGGTYQDQ